MITEKLCLLGSTGSIGRQTIDVAKKHNIRITAISGNKNEELLYEQALQLKPEIVCTADETVGRSLRTRLSSENIDVIYGSSAVNELPMTADCDTVLDALVGIAGLMPLLSAIRADKKIALANKESLVCGGEIVKAELRHSNAKILPVDSEHSAIFQCLQGNSDNRIKSIYLTCSGGPFFGKDRDYLNNVTKADTLSHPNWNMGNKITVDSATLMNKGFEVIEAMHLYDLKLEQINVVIHRQSIIHSMVEFEDNSVIAQFGVPDMRIPIQYALTYPERLESPAGRLSMQDLAHLTFEKPDEDTFSCLALAKKAICKGGLYPTVINGANEYAVDKFLKEKIGFLDIEGIVEYAMDHFEQKDLPITIDNISNANSRAIELAEEYYRKHR